MIVAKIKVTDSIAYTVYRKVIPAGIIGAQVEFEYADDIWNGLRKTVVFRGAVTKDVVTDENIVTIPQEVAKKPLSSLSVGIYGVDVDGNLAIPTIWAALGTVHDSANPSGDTTTDPTLPVWAQIQAMIGNLDDLETEAKNNLVDAVNEAMTKGVDVSGASVGQIIKVAAVDDAGKPTEWEPADLPKQAQSDWDQNDESQADFVKNRPFYEKIDSVILMPETQFSNLTHVYSPEISTPADVNGEFINDFTISNDGTMIINTGDTVKVTFDGTVYECVRQDQWIGNQSLTSYAWAEDTGEPFLFSLGTIPSFHTKSTDCVVKVEADISQIKKIDSKFLEPPIAPGSGENSTIENCTENYYWYTKNTANGKYSHAEGASNSADGECSHSEGFQCLASGECSHAEGSGNKATGYRSHAEGGFGEAIGDDSHSEGEHTKAIGDDSHSEGKGTIAKRKCQHVQGRYNVEDPITDGMYAHIVGNGTGDDKRSNAHTLDWSGNAWFAGEVKVGGTGQYDYAAKTLATTEDIPVVDGTLTQSGQAADAKAVGDRLSTLSEEIVTTSESKVAAHNTGTDTHSDIRLLIQGLTDRLNALADSDDTTLDQLSEVVAYIKSNRTLIEAITTSKVSVADIVDNLTTNATNKPLSAAQGVVIKTLIDALRNDKLDAAELTNAINTALAQAKASGEFDGADGQDGQNGAPGQDGITPTIGDNGNWYLGDTDTGKPSRGDTGPKGEKGDTGPQGEQGPQGPAGAYGKSAYQYAQEGGYTGTEAEFAAKLAQEIPTALPNPNALTFTGAVTGSYDGSEPLTVEIPSGGGEDELPIIQEYTIEGDETASIVFSGLPNISEFLLKIAWEWQSTAVTGTVRVSFSTTLSGYKHRVGRIPSVSTGVTGEIIIRGRPIAKNGNIVVLSAVATSSRDTNEAISVSELTSTSVISVWWADSEKYFPAGTTVSLRGK